MLHNSHALSPIALSVISDSSLCLCFSSFDYIVCIFNACMIPLTLCAYQTRNLSLGSLHLSLSFHQSHYLPCLCSACKLSLSRVTLLLVCSGNSHGPTYVLILKLLALRKLPSQKVSSLESGHSIRYSED